MGRSAAKAGDKDEAFYYLEWALRANPSDEQGAHIWVWLSQIYNQPEDKRICLEQAIALHPTNPLARRGLALLDGRLQADVLVRFLNLFISFIRCLLKVSQSVE